MSPPALRPLVSLEDHEGLDLEGDKGAAEFLTSWLGRVLVNLNIFTQCTAQDSRQLALDLHSLS